jgi:hypothetical protein
LIDEAGYVLLTGRLSLAARILGGCGDTHSRDAANFRHDSARTAPE